jgi:hypothetical protein
MLGSEAVQRVNRGIGFRRTGNSLETQIAACFQEAQDDLEMGKTLPKFLLREGQSLVLGVGNHTVPLPDLFARASDDEYIHYVKTNESTPTFLQPKAIYSDALKAYQGSDLTMTNGFKVYVIRNTVIDFILAATVATTFTWSYYKYADPFALNAANEWLSHKSAKWWLIGECGYRISQDLRDDRAAAIFDGIRQRGRAATFGDILAMEDSAGPLQMGANL